MSELKVAKLERKVDEKIISMLEGMLGRAREGGTIAIIAMEIDIKGDNARHGVGQISTSDFIAAIELWKHDVLHQLVNAPKR
jgi:hypothetical protein